MCGNYYSTLLESSCCHWRPTITERSHPYAGTRAASLLAEGLRRYTSQHPGGLRALATDLKIKQATVLSQMGTGRIGIPLDRASELAAKLGMDVQHFCLAVLEQRAPSVYGTLIEDIGVDALVSRSPQARRVCNVIAGMPEVSDEQVDIISKVLADRHPAERWIRPGEVPALALMREYYPDGPGMTDLGLLRAAIEALRELDL